MFFLCFLQFIEEIAIFVQKERDIIVRIHLYLFAHAEPVIDFQVKFALEFFLIHFRFLCHEGLVLQISHNIVLGEILMQEEILYHNLLYLIQILLC
jgi:hypothetical protein